MRLIDGLTEKEAIARRKEYARAHPFCLRPREKNGVWRFCKEPTQQIDHIPHRGKWERPRIYFPFCGPFAGNCHLGWKHGQAEKTERAGRIMLRQFTIKWMIGEVTMEEVPVYMKGRTWYDPAVDESHTEIQDVMIRMAFEMQTLYNTEARSCRTLSSQT